MEVQIKLTDVVRVEVKGFKHERWRPRGLFRWQPTRTKVRLIGYVHEDQVSDRWYDLHDASKITVYINGIE